MIFYLIVSNNILFMFLLKKILLINLNIILFYFIIKYILLI